MFQYKLMLFGFPDLCKDYEDVLLHLKQVPPLRAQVETMEQCYLIDMQTGKKYDIGYDNKGLFVKDFDKDLQNLFMFLGLAICIYNIIVAIPNSQNHRKFPQYIFQILKNRTLILKVVF